MTDKPQSFEIVVKPTNPVAIELSEDLFPKIESSQDVDIGDEIIPKEEALTGNLQGKRWDIVGIELDLLYVEEKRLGFSYVYPLDFEKARLNPYGLYI